MTYINSHDNVLQFPTSLLVSKIITLLALYNKLMMITSITHVDTVLNEPANPAFNAIRSTLLLLVI